MKCVYSNNKSAGGTKRKGPLPRDDSEAEEDLFTLKAISESLSYWEPPGDPEGETVTGLDCTVPENTK